ncbi:MAG TPA: hypothetical protein VGY30_10685 [Solirubrobacteraceae bacterium]|jgi:hypothetical protein|nr:hypothetical protein [Solirubrobacteraceae bacterium]
MTDVDLVDVIADGVCGATADLSAIASSLDGLSYLTPSETRRLQGALADVDTQVRRARTRVGAIAGDRK